MTPDELPPSFRGSSLKGKVALVTGSTQGLGEATVRLFKERGCRGLVITGRNEERGKRIANELNSDSCEAIFIRANLENLDEVRNILSVTVETFGTIDVLVNAAATIDRVSILDTTPEDYDRIMNVNVRAPFFLMQGVAKIMEEKKVAGAIVNLSSTASYGSMPMLPAFGMSKGALNVATKNASHSLMWSKIRVNAIAIGWSLLKPDEIAHCIAFCASDDSGMMTGCVIDFDQSVLGAGNVPVPQRIDEFDSMHNVTISFNSKHRYAGATPVSQEIDEPPAPETVSKASASSPKTESVPTLSEEDPKPTSAQIKPERKTKAEKSNSNKRRPKSPHPQRPLPKAESRLVPELDTQAENRRLLLIKQSSSKRWPPMAPLSKQISNSKLLMSDRETALMNSKSTSSPHDSDDDIGSAMTQKSSNISSKSKEIPHSNLPPSNHPPSRAPLTKQISKSKLLMSDRETALMHSKSTTSPHDSEEEASPGETVSDKSENSQKTSPKTTERLASNPPSRAPLTKQISKSKLLMSDRETALMNSKSTASPHDSEEEASPAATVSENSQKTSPKTTERSVSNPLSRRSSRDQSPSPPKRMPSIPGPPLPNSSGESSNDEDHPNQKEFRQNRKIQAAGEQTRPDDYSSRNDPSTSTQRKKERARRRNSAEKLSGSPKVERRNSADKISGSPKVERRNSAEKISGSSKVERRNSAEKLSGSPKVERRNSAEKISGSSKVERRNSAEKISGSSKVERRNSAEKIYGSPKAISKSPPKPPKSPKPRTTKSPKARPPMSPKARSKKSSSGENHQDAKEFRTMRRVQEPGEVTRPDEFLPSNDPDAAARKKKKQEERAKKKHNAGLSESSSDHRAEKVEEWLGGSGKSQRRSWKVKNVREIETDA